MAVPSLRPGSVHSVPIRDFPFSPAEYNPRVDLLPGDPAYELIAGGLAEFGLVQPLVGNVRTGNLVAGHQRLRILGSTGAESVLVFAVDLDPVRERALNLLLNSQEAQGRWDDGKLRQLLAELSDTMPCEGLELSLTGFLDETISALLDGPGDPVPGAVSHDSADTLAVPECDKYKKQWGIIVTCSSEAEQQTVYERLVSDGYSCKVVCV